MKNLAYAQPSIIQKIVHHIANGAYSMIHTVGQTVGHTVGQKRRLRQNVLSSTASSKSTIAFPWLNIFDGTYSSKLPFVSKLTLCLMFT